jgi:hypothetical protein
MIVFVGSPLGCWRKKMDDDNENDRRRGLLACGILSPVLDWPPEEQAAVRAATEEAEADNVIFLADYRLH